MNIATDSISSTITTVQNLQTQPPPPSSSTGGGSESGMSAPAIEPKGSSLSNGGRQSIIANMKALQNSGSDVGDIKASITDQLEANGVDVSDPAQRSGQLVDMMV